MGPSTQKEFNLYYGSPPFINLKPKTFEFI